MNVAAAQPIPNHFGPVAQRPSGLIVPAALAEAKVPGQADEGPSKDADGRQRVVLTRADQKKIDQAIKVLHQAGLGIVVGCKREGGCGLPMTNEGNGTPDSGYGCRCSRVHFVR